MKLGMQVGLGPGHIVLDGDPALLPQRGTPPIFNPYPLRPNGCIDQDFTWYGDRPRPRRLCVRWGPSSPSPKRGKALSPIFGPCPLWRNGWMDQDCTWRGGGHWSKPHCARCGRSSPPKKGAPQFLAHFYCGQTVGCTKMPLGMEVGLS